MYWNNPIVARNWPGFEIDPIVESSHDGVHCLFWNPAFDYKQCSTNQRLRELCTWARGHINGTGLDAFVANPVHWYDIANLVKLNIWIHDIRKQGIVKPWMILDQGDGTYLAGTGDSRLRCLELIPEITTVPAFISCATAQAHKYQGLEPITDFDQFAKICRAELDQEFLFRLTDAKAPYGIYWYEYNTNQTRHLMPQEKDAVRAFYDYYKDNREPITMSWFNKHHEWKLNVVGPVV